MPRTPHCFTNNQTVGEWAMVVGTGCTHREKFITTAGHDYVLAISLPQHRPAIRKLADRKSSFQIGFGRIFHIPKAPFTLWSVVSSPYL
jgi:hypothetical protein